jgi:hypothetical protein
MEVLVKPGDTIKRDQIIANSASRAMSDRRSCISRSAKALRRLTRFNS